jgi:hypothetical protein
MENHDEESIHLEDNHEDIMNLEDNDEESIYLNEQRIRHPKVLAFVSFSSIINPDKTVTFNIKSND